MQTSFTHKYMYIYPSILVVSVFFVLRGKKREKEYDDYNKNNSINQIILNTFPRKP